MIDETELVNGQKVYRLIITSPKLGYESKSTARMDELTWTGKFFKRKEHCDEYNETILKLYSLTEDAAKISAYKEVMKIIKEGDQKLRSKIRNIQKHADDMHETFSYLKEKYPEEFL